MDWIPALSTTGVLALVLWAARKAIAARLNRGIQHEYDKKLETLRADLRRSEEQLRADLRARESEIAALRSGAISALASRQSAVDKRRLEAIDQLWSANIALGPARSISSFMAVINFEEAAKAAEKNGQFRQVIEALGSGFDPKNMGSAEAQKARPYVSPMAWATYTAILAIVSFAVMRWLVLKGGMGQKDYADKDALTKMLKTALPHRADYLDKVGSSGYHFLFEELESQLLFELQRMLTGSESDRASVEQAAEIVKQSTEIMNKLLSESNAVQPAAPPDALR